MLVLTREEVRRLLDPGAMLDALERAFVGYSAGRASVPPRVAARAAAGLVGAMPGYLPGAGLEAKLVTVFPQNRDRPSHQGLIALFDEGDGTPLAVMDGGHITDLRTAGGSAVSVRALAREDSRVLAVLGAGAQGGSHLEVVPLVREFGEVRLASRNRESAEALSRRHGGVQVVDSFEHAVRGADVVCCCTDAREPILRFEWLAPGTHVTAVGGTFGPELDRDTVERSAVFSSGGARSPKPHRRGHMSCRDWTPSRSQSSGRSWLESGPDASTLTRSRYTSPPGWPWRTPRPPGWCTTVPWLKVPGRWSTCDPPSR